MPNIRSQRITDDEIYIQASDGREWTMTRAGVQTIYQAQTGNAAARRQKTLDAVKLSAETALGAEQVPVAVIDFDFDTAAGKLTKLAIVAALGG